MCWLTRCIIDTVKWHVQLRQLPGQKVVQHRHAQPAHNTTPLNIIKYLKLDRRKQRKNIADAIAILFEWFQLLYTHVLFLRSCSS